MIALGQYTLLGHCCMCVKLCMVYTKKIAANKWALFCCPK